jgi:RNA polymerase sigma factor (TIGR02999 family)
MRDAVDQAQITRLLERWSHGEVDSFDALVPIVYDELRKLADHHLRNERAEHTLQPTALVHEAYLRLRGVRDMQLVNRAHFYGAAAQVMRRVLVDHARRRGARKRGGGEAAAALTANLEAPVDLSLDLLALSEALDQLQAIALEKAKVVELRYFGGLSVEDTAAYLDLAPVTVKRYFAFARAWLYRALANHAHDAGA